MYFYKFCKIKIQLTEVQNNLTTKVTFFLFPTLEVDKDTNFGA